MYLDYYISLLKKDAFPDFLIKYLNVPSLNRLKGVGYFCGMDYASKSIYNFREYISRYDHSLTTSLLVYKLTRNQKVTLSALFHDIATPCFSHVIDYMNQDFLIEESTEMNTGMIIMKDYILQEILDSDKINPDEIINFKKYSIVDNDRPKLCADRLDGIILNGIGWTKNLSFTDIYDILNSIKIDINELGEKEIGLNNYLVANKIVKVNDLVNDYTHTKEDIYMMMLLANITKYAIKKGYISDEDLYNYSERELLNNFIMVNDKVLNELMDDFENIKEVPNIEKPMVKKRKLNPLVNGKRIS